MHGAILQRTAFAAEIQPAGVDLGDVKVFARHKTILARLLGLPQRLAGPRIDLQQQRLHPLGDGHRFGILDILRRSRRGLDVNRAPVVKVEP